MTGGSKTLEDQRRGSGKRAKNFLGRKSEDTISDWIKGITKNLESDVNPD